MTIRWKKIGNLTASNALNLAGGYFRCLSKYLVSLLLVLALPEFYAGSAAAQELQRLFFTPEERLSLERERAQKNNATETDVAAVGLSETADATLTQPLQAWFNHGGAVLGSDGNYTIWLNSRPYRLENLPTNMHLIQPFAKGQLKIINPVDGMSYVLLPGQAINLSSGELLDSYNRK